MLCVWLCLMLARLALAYSFGFGGSGRLPDDSKQIVEYELQIDDWLEDVNRDLMEFNKISSKLTWDLTVGKNDQKTLEQAHRILLARNQWKNKVCESRIRRELLTPDQSRKLYLLCRGPKFTNETAKREIRILNEMRATYEVEVCFEENVATPLEKLRNAGQNATDYPKAGECLSGEPDLEWLMKRPDLNPDQLKWTWENWYNGVAIAMRRIYPKVINMQNFVARANGYNDMGEIWREELEMGNLEDLVFKLFNKIKPLYQKLHAVVRHKLLVKYGQLEIDPTGPIPIHLLGNMWGQDWSPLLHLFVPRNETLDLNIKLKEKNWTVHDMVNQAEDYYTSMGLPPMTQKFWKYSIFEQTDNTTMCHGTAANLYNGDDYRMLLCAKVNMEYFYIIHHEMGHLEYNMAYKNQPAIYQEGTNSAFHESIGDVVMHGVMCPQHLHRLGLLTDEELINADVPQMLLMQQALAKIAEIPFALIVDKYRWDVFAGKIDDDHLNAAYWEMNERIRGVVPPTRRGERYLDAGAKFHVPDNTPYIRYFLSSILQMQIFKGLCEISLFGKHPKVGEATYLKIPLHKCDIYGCKKCGRILEKTMSLGASIHWSQALEMLTGKDYISVQPLLEYYHPVEEWLEKFIQLHNVPIGW